MADITTIQPHSSHWQPVSATERYVALDMLRGVALLGVLLVNILSDFCVPLAQHLLVFHNRLDKADCLADTLAAVLLEFKAMTIFSLLFGVGSAIFAERAERRGVSSIRFLSRRYLVLLAIGLCHLLLIWNGDILTLYAICGLLLLPCLRLSPAGLTLAGLAAIAANFLISWDFLWPGDAMLHRLAAEAQAVYAHGALGDVLAFHAQETWHLVLPLLASSLPRTWGLMALGVAIWRIGVFQNPQRHLDSLWAVVLLGGSVGGWATAQTVRAVSTGQPAAYPSQLLEAASYIPLGLAFASGALLALHHPVIKRLLSVCQAAGQMALTNYLMQSIVLSVLFYGYGLGLAGRVGSAAAAGIGFVVYIGQLLFSALWLRRYQFGPAEWLWRSITYGRRQPL